MSRLPKLYFSPTLIKVLGEQKDVMHKAFSLQKANAIYTK